MKQKFRLTLEKNMAAKILSIAAKRGISLGELVEEQLKELLGKEKRVQKSSRH